MRVILFTLLGLFTLPIFTLAELQSNEAYYSPNPEVLAEINERGCLPEIFAEADMYSYSRSLGGIIKKREGVVRYSLFHTCEGEAPDLLARADIVFDGKADTDLNGRLIAPNGKIVPLINGTIWKRGRNDRLIAVQTNLYLRSFGSVVLSAAEFGSGQWYLELETSKSRLEVDSRSSIRASSIVSE